MSSPLNANLIRNIAIIAHVDHGKTTMVNRLLEQSDSFPERGATPALDTGLEQKRGITILAKNTAIQWGDYRINLVDTPGHADFGGEVERVLSMVDSVLLLVDAVDGPMPQTRFVTQKAFLHKLKPIVVINKIDLPGARPDWVIDQVFDLFDRLGATEEQLDFPVVYASAVEGYATLDPKSKNENFKPLIDAIIEHAPPPQSEIDKPFQMQISSLDYSNYVGTIGIGRIHRGSIQTNKPVAITNASGQTRSGRILQLLGYVGIERQEILKAYAGDIIAVTGIEKLSISDTLCHPDHVEALPMLSVDEPTMSMTFQVNDSPVAGRDGKYVTSRQIRERLEKELIHNVALRVTDMEDASKFRISGRGELHLSILIENMRQEGYELGVSRPEVILKEIDSVLHEPYEMLIIDIEEQHQGVVMETLGTRRGELLDTQYDGRGRIRLDYRIATRALMGFRTEFMTMTSGTGLMHHVFDNYNPAKKNTLNKRNNGVLISNQAGKANAFALFNLQARGKLMLDPQTEVYEGMIVGIHTRDNDLVVNVTKAKQLTNMRASGSDEHIVLTPPVRLTLEQALEFIEDDELIEVTPSHIRLRKKWLKEQDRKRFSRGG